MSFRGITVGFVRTVSGFTKVNEFRLGQDRRHANAKTRVVGPKDQ